LTALNSAKHEGIQCGDTKGALWNYKWMTYIIMR